MALMDFPALVLALMLVVRFLEGVEF